MSFNALNVVFCLPGTSFSNNFLFSWTQLVVWLGKKGIPFVYITQTGANIFAVRNGCLQGSVARGPDQKPFNGEIDYSHIMWIDSDMVFEPSDFELLLDAGLDNVSGLYKASTGAFATVENMDHKLFAKEGRFRWLTEDDMEGREEPFEVGYTGLGFTLVKYGVFESLKYPWFKAIPVHEGKLVSQTSEDSGFCIRSREAGHPVHVHPGVRLGHEKPTILR